MDSSRESKRIVILGSGIAGIAAGHHLRQAGFRPVIHEKEGDWGGLCGNFSIKGFRFDRFVHFSFPSDKRLLKFFNASSPLYAHFPRASNYEKGRRIRHPAQVNLYPLSTKERVEKASRTCRKRNSSNALNTLK
jgi:protoporphyrinogen oxidase